MSMEHDDEPTLRVTTSYPFGRLQRAIETALTHSDPATRRRAEDKALTWEAVLEGMTSGALQIGSRTPVADTPSWVTLEVAAGGFASGRYVAEGPLDDEERRLLADVIPSDDEAVNPRHRLNIWHLSDDGLDRLDDALRSGSYVVEVPEHAALLVVAWLVSHGRAATALDLVAEIYPFIHRLRFYPSMQAGATAARTVAKRESVGTVTGNLLATRVPDQLAAMNETLTVWHPLLDRLVELWSETMVDGWPCARWPEDWAERRSSILADYQGAAATHDRSREHVRGRSTFAILLEALSTCEHDSSALTARQVGRVRAALVRSIERWGAPGSEARRQLRIEQAAHARRPTNEQIAAAVAARLQSAPGHAGIADLEPVLEPVTLETGQPPVPLPTTIVRKVERALEAPIEELVARGIVSSAEVLAELFPQITSHVAGGAFDVEELRELYAQTYAAFRRRRSLLLLDLQHQVRIDELPWIRALEPFKASAARGQVQARESLRTLTQLAFVSFPQSILPNPLVMEMASLAKQADLELPLVEEVAADIFMGTFTTKWEAAADIAARETEGSLYARYYSLPSPSFWPAPPRLQAQHTSERYPWRKPVAMRFTQVCQERSREAANGDGSFVARNGAVIEQSQILTTHNLAPLVAALELRERIESQATELAATAFRWMIAQQNTRWGSWHAELQMTKNTAYAWRQAIYFLSLVDGVEQQAAVSTLRQIADEHPGPWRERFEQVVVGLEANISGSTFDDKGRLDGGRRFLGWSIGPHWLLPHRADDSSS